MTLTVKDAKRQARQLGLTIRKTDAGEWRVRFRDDKDPETGYFTNDLGDALDTARAMRRQRDENAHHAAARNH